MAFLICVSKVSCCKTAAGMCDAVVCTAVYSSTLQCYSGMFVLLFYSGIPASLASEDLVLLQVYSFGVTVWQIMERKRPFEGLEPYQVTHLSMCFA